MPRLDQPLIYTVKGNLPLSSLTYQTGWDVQDTYIKFSERYLLDGEVVRESAHVFDRHGVQASVIAAPIG